MYFWLSLFCLKYYLLKHFFPAAHLRVVDKKKTPFLYWEGVEAGGNVKKNYTFFYKSFLLFLSFLLFHKFSSFFLLYSLKSILGFFLWELTSGVSLVIFSCELSNGLNIFHKEWMWIWICKELEFKQAEVKYIILHENWDLSIPFHFTALQQRSLLSSAGLSIWNFNLGPEANPCSTQKLHHTILHNKTEGWKQLRMSSCCTNVQCACACSLPPIAII